MIIKLSMYDWWWIKKCKENLYDLHKDYEIELLIGLELSIDYDFYLALFWIIIIQNVTGNFREIKLTQLECLLFEISSWTSPSCEFALYHRLDDDNFAFADWAQFSQCLAQQ